jgi:hypothetical protein
LRFVATTVKLKVRGGVDAILFLSSVIETEGFFDFIGESGSEVRVKIGSGGIVLLHEEVFEVFVDELFFGLED